MFAGFNKIDNCVLQAPSLHPDKDYANPITREVIQCSDAVVVLIYSSEADAFVLLKQFRTGVYFNSGNDDPFLWQCVAGMIDKDNTPEEIARAEAFEEAGLEIDVLHHIATAYASPGRMTEKSYIYFAEVTGIPSVGVFGLEHEGEEILTQLVKRADAYKMMDDFVIIDAVTLLALNWYRARHG